MMLVRLGLLALLPSVALGQVWAPPPANGHAPAKPPSFSGMVKIDPASFLVVHDEKDGSQGPFLGVLTVAFGRAPVVTPVDVVGGRMTPFLNDLEAVAAVPGWRNRFYLCESTVIVSPQDEKTPEFGRVVEVELVRRNDSFVATVQRWFYLPRDLTDQVEGVVVVPRKDKPDLFVLGLRGGGAGDAKRGKLVLCTADKEKGQLVRLPKDAELVLDSPGAGFAKGDRHRDCADLYLDPANNLWAAAADPGDPGPFRSVIYQVAVVRPESDDKPVELVEAKATWTLDGVKVEAIAGPAWDDSALSVASDDEDYGGIWRPLMPPKK